MKKIKQLLTFFQDLKYTGLAFLFEPCDLWVGLFFDKKKRWLYILPFPMVGVVIKFESEFAQTERIVNENVRNLSREQVAELVSKHIKASDGKSKLTINVNVKDPVELTSAEQFAKSVDNFEDLMNKLDNIYGKSN